MPVETAWWPETRARVMTLVVHVFVLCASVWQAMAA